MLKRMLRVASFAVLTAVAVVFVFPTHVLPQDKDWRTISPADLELGAPMVEPDADAEAIFWEVSIDDSSDEGFSRRHYVRIKIFTERGREKYSKFDIPYIKGLKIKDLAARVIRPDGTIVEIGKNDIFERELVRASGVKLQAKSFAVPNIAPGVIIEYKYKESFSDGGATGMKLELQKEIPVRLLSYRVRPYNNKPPTYRLFNTSGTEFVKDDKGYYIAQLSNIPAFKEEPRMPPEDMVRPFILLTGTQYSLVETRSGSGVGIVTKNSNDPKAYWAGVAGENVARVRFIKSSASDLKKQAQAIIAGGQSDEEKVKLLYYFCQNEINNLTYDPSFTDEMAAKLPQINSYADILKNKRGTASQINGLFGALATAAGYEVAYILVGDKSEAFFTPDMTDRRAVTTGGIGVLLGDRFKILRPGTKFAPYGVVQWWQEDTYALCITEKQYYWQNTEYTPPERTNEKRKGKFELSEDGTLKGSVTVELTGHHALSYRLNSYDDSPEVRESAVKSNIQRRLSAAEVTNIKIDNIFEITKPVVISFDVTVPNYATRTGKRLIFKPNFFEANSSVLFSSSQRKYDIFFRNPWSETDIIELKYPSTFMLDNGDAPSSVADSRNIGSDTVKISHSAPQNTLFYERNFFFGGNGVTLFKVDSYPALKGLFERFHAVDSHELSLKQK